MASSKSTTVVNPSPTTCNDSNNFETELIHLNKRVFKLKESIQLASISTALQNIHTWKENCLNAILNCVYEWRHIVSFYRLNNDYSRIKNEEKDDDHDEKDDDVEEVSIEGYEFEDDQHQVCVPQHCHHQEQKTVCEQDNVYNAASQIFSLIQMVMQIGPLKGSNPGYFKRCGVHVAKLSLDFLVQCIISKDTSDNNISHHDETITSLSLLPYENLQFQLLFTLKQSQIMKKWIRNATKAIETNKGPSKAAIKLQQSSMSKKSIKKMSRLKDKQKQNNKK